MNENPLLRIQQFGQSIWLDYIDRRMIRSGSLKKLIENDGVRGEPAKSTESGLPLGARPRGALTDLWLGGDEPASRRSQCNPTVVEGRSPEIVPHVQELHR